MSKLFILFVFIVSAFTAKAQEDFPPIPPPPPEIRSSIYLVSTDPKTPQPQRPSDPADAGDLLIFVDTRGETLTITDGRGVGLILVLGDGQGTVVGPILVLGDEQGKVVSPTLADWRVVGGSANLRGEEEGVFVGFEKNRVQLSCDQALGLIVDANLIEVESVNSALESGLSGCQTLKSILIDINPNVIRPLIKTESGTLI
jgi:hypothetical protein